MPSLRKTWSSTRSPGPRTCTSAVALVLRVRRPILFQVSLDACLALVEHTVLILVARLLVRFSRHDEARECVMGDESANPSEQQGVVDHTVVLHRVLQVAVESRRAHEDRAEHLRGLAHVDVPRNP